MSLNAEAIHQERDLFGHVPAWIWFGIWAYGMLLIDGNMLLQDSDTYWHIITGKWILDHGALPRVDIYSFTRTGEPWISSSWLAQVLYAGAYELAGWAGPVILATTSIAAAFALLAFILGRQIPSTYAVVVACAAFVLSANHFLARPHVLALPVMLAWASGLVSASERREAPSFWLLPLIALWANLHGGFVFGMVLVAAFAFDALWNADKSQRRSLAARWVTFGTCALVACCATPYGWDSILASRKILELGELLHVISEWMPANFASFGRFEACLVALMAGALFCGVKLSPPRIVLVLGLFHMALSHLRNIEIFALLIPLVVLAPLGSQFGLQGDRRVRTAFPVAAAALLAVIVGVSTWAYVASHAFFPETGQSPAAAVDVLKQRNPRRVLNELAFGGYLISRGMPVFIDGRAELYGEQFEMTYLRALQLKDVDLFLNLLKDYDIDAVLLTPTTPAATLLDHLDGWQRIYSDETAVLHIRTANGAPTRVWSDRSFGGVLSGSACQRPVKDPAQLPYGFLGSVCSSFTT
jgi:hypothetical protein